MDTRSLPAMLFGRLPAQEESAAMIPFKESMGGHCFAEPSSTPTPLFTWTDHAIPAQQLV